MNLISKKPIHNLSKFLMLLKAANMLALGVAQGIIVKNYSAEDAK